MPISVLLLLFCAAASASTHAQISTNLEERNTNASVPLHVGGGVSAPRAIYAPEPEFSEEAGKAGYQETCVLSLVVGVDGMPRDIRVVHKLGMQLDEKAIEAVRNWKFEPVRKNGKPVAVYINVEISFKWDSKGVRQVLSPEQTEQIRDARSREQAQIYSRGPRTQDLFCIFVGSRGALSVGRYDCGVAF